MKRNGVLWNVEQAAAVFAGDELVFISCGEEGGGELDEATEAQVPRNRQDCHCIVTCEPFVSLQQRDRDLVGQVDPGFLKFIEARQLEAEILELLRGRLVFHFLDHDIEVLKRNQASMFFSHALSPARIAMRSPNLVTSESFFSFAGF